MNTITNTAIAQAFAAGATKASLEGFPEDLADEVREAVYAVAWFKNRESGVEVRLLLDTLTGKMFAIASASMTGGLTLGEWRGTTICLASRQREWGTFRLLGESVERLPRTQRALRALVDTEVAEVMHAVFCAD